MHDVTAGHRLDTHFSRRFVQAPLPRDKHDAAVVFCALETRLARSLVQACGMPLVLIHDVTLSALPFGSTPPLVALQAHEPAVAAVRVHARFLVALPPKTTKIERELMLRGAVRPLDDLSLDRLLRLALEALTGVAFVDDRCVVEAVVERHYALEPRTELRVFTL